MPKTTPDIKVDNVRRFGGEVRLVGNSFNEAQIASVEYAKAENKTLIHPLTMLMLLLVKVLLLKNYYNNYRMLM